MSPAPTRPVSSTRRRRWVVLLALTIALALALLLGLRWWLAPGVTTSGPTTPDLAIRADAAAPTAPPPAPRPRDLARETPDAGVDRGLPRGTRLLSPGELRALQRRNRALLKLCYDRVARAGLVPRKANVKVMLGDRGRIRSVTVDAGGPLGACLQRMVRGFRFSRSLKAQSVSFSLVFGR